MLLRRQVTKTAILAIAGTLSAGALTATATRADDPLAPIVGAIERDRKKACGDIPDHPILGGFYSYDKQLEAAAQAYARSDVAPPPPPGYQTVKYFKGTGDPEAHAINSAYTRGVGQVIADCAIQNYGVGFVRNGETDVVTMAFGVRTPPPPAPPRDPNAPPFILK